MDNLKPKYEVKFLLDPTIVLGPDNKLNDGVLTAFNMPSTVTKMNVQFLDTSEKEIFRARWSPRIRKIEGEEGFELTYKKRYQISSADIDATLNTANKDGFHAEAAEYEAQVEWGYEKQTLSISREELVEKVGISGMDLPDESASREMLIEKAPEEFNNWKHSDWGKGALRSSLVFGPVLAKRSIGKWEGKKLFIEIWPIRNKARTGIEYLVEASFKAKTHDEASDLRQKLVKHLEDKHWLLPEDSLKTELIMKRYGEDGPSPGLRDGV
jgi:hypothetical protein